MKRSPDSIPSHFEEEFAFDLTPDIREGRISAAHQRRFDFPSKPGPTQKIACPGVPTKPTPPHR